MEKNFRELRQRVLDANLLLPKYNLITLTWGNVSEIDRINKVVAIKPSGIEYDIMTVDDIVVVDLSGQIVWGNLRASSDVLTHIELYNNFQDVGGIVHTHSRHATSFAQAGRDIIPLGSTHADYFYGTIPCTRQMKPNEIISDYELNTGKVIVETFKTRNINPNEVSACIVFSHGPFIWGKNCFNAVHNALVLEEISCMNIYVELLSPNSERMQQVLLDKHFKRKHGPDAYYGQK